jgi:hypothetical protein
MARPARRSSPKTPARRRFAPPAGTGVYAFHDVVVLNEYRDRNPGDHVPPLHVSNGVGG